MSQYSSWAKQEARLGCLAQAVARKRKPFIHVERQSAQSVLHRARRLCEIIESSRNEIHHALKEYATYPAVEDEIDRVVDLLTHLDANIEFLNERGLRVAAFMPRNQLLYAIFYMGVVPSFVTSALYLHPPMSALGPMQNLLKALPILEVCPNLTCKLQSHQRFLEQTREVVDCVLFAGTYENACSVKRFYGDDVLFVLSGAGHNPVVVEGSAQVQRAADSIVRLCFHNQGQDCAAPNVVFVSEDIVDVLTRELIERADDVVGKIALGHHPRNMIGANTDSAHVKSIHQRLARLGSCILFNANPQKNDRILGPVITLNRMEDGPLFDEMFAPFIRLQAYKTVTQLDRYFSLASYESKAMYLTIFGEDTSLVGRTRIHPEETILRNTDLHLEERGILPYGGYGVKGSSIWNGQHGVASPVLPHREISRILRAADP